MTPGQIFTCCAFLGAISFMLWYNVDRSTVLSGFDYSSWSFVKPDVKIMSNVTKWIVVTSIQLPTEDVKNLANQTGWTVVVVADKKTPTDWSYPNVHFLSIEEQLSFGGIARLLPFNSYARKTLGYLYAIKNGAEWIYDTDDDNKPYGLGLEQFDYEETVSGLRYIPKSANIGERLFNPYKFYGFKKMWPRGFPLEYLEGHTNGKDRMILCRKMKTAAVQQGVVHNDPDVDAIYRLENADKEHGLHVSFNKIAPAITLEEGTYSPWNSQNTLFHYRAFFTMFLPTTVAFRVTDIWRSYFAQKLLHLIGEEVAFYPVNAVQFRNAHDYLKDFEQEIDVYEKSGRIVRFLDEWYCRSDTLESCTLSLAQEFADRNFWDHNDYKLVKHWIEALKDIGYIFPQLKFESHQEEYTVNATEKYGNCREANLDLGIREYFKDGKKDLSREKSILTAYSELQHWCAEENETYELLPTPQELSQTLASGVWKDREANVLVIMNNYPWKTAIGLLQRMYSSFFGTVVFCGTWDPANIVNGYFFIGDDTIINFWHNISMDIVVNPNPPWPNKIWWKDSWPETLIQLLDGKYKDDKRVLKLMEQVEINLQSLGISNVTARQHFANFTGRLVSDWVYIPSSQFDYISDLIELLTESHYFVENGIRKIFETIKVNYEPNFTYDWSEPIIRGTRYDTYNPDNLGFHPLKMSRLDTDANLRASFCKHVIGGFIKNIFKKTVST